MPATWDVVRPKRPPQRRGTTINIDVAPPRRPIPAKARDAASALATSLRKCVRTLDAIRTSDQRIRNGLARLAPIVEARKAVKASEVRDVARAERATPTSVQAANAARWPRLGR